MNPNPPVDSLGPEQENAAVVDVVLVNDQVPRELQRQSVTIDRDLLDLFIYSAGSAAAHRKKEDKSELTFSAMLAAMVGQPHPLGLWLQGFFDRLGVRLREIIGTDISPRALHWDQREFRTTHSFRTAWSKAVELRDAASPGAPVGARHFVAAYAVCDDYHLWDFQRFGIDRREWCLDLSDELASRFPTEASAWKAYAKTAPALASLKFDNDLPSGRDQLHLSREVESLARVVAARSTSTPLSIGVFGAWGTGKSFFLQRLRATINSVAREEGSADGEFFPRIAQVEFNAWHYGEGNLIASLVDHIFRNLRVDAVDEDDLEVARRGAELLAIVTEKDSSLRELQARTKAAQERHESAKFHLAEVERSLPAGFQKAEAEVARCVRAQADAETRLTQVLQKRDRELARHRIGAEIATSATAVMGETASELARSYENVEETIRSAWSLRGKVLPIAIGVVLALASFGFTLVRGTQMWGRLIGATAALSGITTVAGTWIARAKALAEAGQGYSDARRQSLSAANGRVESAFADEIARLRDERNQRSNETAEARARRADVDATAAADTVASRSEEFDRARQDAAAAQQELGDLRTELDTLSVGTLLSDFLGDRIASTTYRGELGLFSQVRNDFDRLSKLIARANADSLIGEQPPLVNRIVLYIDDLDRCEPHVVISVLRVVHLLLGFPLFVCVVAVDPRWLTAVLAGEPGLGIGTRADRADVADAKDTKVDDELGRPATPADYIEKIFQVPIWLRPIDQSRCAAVLRSWLVDDMSQDELEFLTKLEPYLDGKPRSLKRIANCYRLVKAGLSDVAALSFADSRGIANSLARPYHPYQICLTYLAILNGDRAKALVLAEALDHADGVTPVSSWLAGLKDRGLAAFLLESLAPDSELQVTVLQEWFQRTRRYSFYL